MRLAGRLQAAIDVLDDVATRRRPVAESLKDWGLAHRFAGAADRAAIGTLVYDVLRRRASLAWRMESDAPVALAYGALFALMQQSGKRVAEMSLLAELANEPFAPCSLDGACLHAWQNRDLCQAPDEVRADIPLWCKDFFENIYGEGWIVQAYALGERPPLDLRLNRLKSTGEKLLKSLSDHKAQALTWFEDALRIAPAIDFVRHPNVQVTPAFQKGWFEIQDLGSQIVARLVKVFSHRQVLDYCAGGGGKTLALASQMQNRGQIYAYDSDKTRLAPIYARLKRAGVRNAQILGTSSALTALEGKMDMVLVDAPCSGSGTWRRHPDAKWRLREYQLQHRVEAQRAILDAASHFVRPGGILAYVTCSLFNVENNLQIRHFIEKRQDFQMLDMHIIWQDSMTKEAPSPHFVDIGLLLSPFSTLSDGFYVALLQRKM